MAWWAAADGGGGRVGRRHACHERQARQSSHQQCSTPGCERCFRAGRCFHRHCCSQCTVGEYTDRCNSTWERYILRAARQSLPVCASDSCERVAGLQHIHCCQHCKQTDGGNHDVGCDVRQQTVHVRRARQPPRTLFVEALEVVAVLQTLALAFLVLLLLLGSIPQRRTVLMQQLLRRRFWCAAAARSVKLRVTQ